eukprot:TRINITY_DN1794_c0_g1_i35.p1 TRINITY_DN1794_c0_g1~~TRINITY_DN1794_c0_g1_i35.p1  ORF type:complete len:155 (-),score=14.51 TRINITY_DN1794_c0_g1_i35:284-748(-)
MESLPRLVPWLDWSEWSTVKGWLYSEDREKRRLGVKRVTTWQHRGPLPVSVICTANLVEVSLRDESTHNPTNSNSLSDTEVRLMYCMAISRMVNTIADHFAGKVAVPIGSVAKQIDLPAILVDLRHQSSHKRDLPSLFLLRSATKQVEVPDREM